MLLNLVDRELLRSGLNDSSAKKLNFEIPLMQVLRVAAESSVGGRGKEIDKWLCGLPDKGK